MTINAILQSDYAALQAALATAGTLQGASASTVAPVLAAAEQFSTDLASAIATLDPTIVAGMNGGLAAADAIAYMTTQVAAVTNEYALLMTKAFVDRIDVNLQNNAG